MRFSPAAVLVLMLPVASCGNAKADKLARGVQFAHRQVAAANTNAIAALSLGSIVEGGGTLTTYLAANMPENADLPPFADGQPRSAWSVVLREAGADSVIIEGYGETLERPLLADTVVLTRVRRP